ncbi:hypothetical protein COTS27_01333 [Spirochaetota bacterium]|nr:hypothetical protein COTS27_01333 [Spirochaetota bacterium]
MAYQLIFERRFVMGHRLISGSSLQCSIPHGHNEYIKIYLAPKEQHRLDGNENFVELFKKAKKKWHHFIDNILDHTLQLAHNDPLIDYFKEHEPTQLSRLVITQGDPTTEMLCACLMSKLQAFLNYDNSPLHCVQFELQETPTNTVTLTGINAFTSVLPKAVIKKSQATSTSPTHWWERHDFSINDLKPQLITHPNLTH